MIPGDLPGLDPQWSRQVHAHDAAGIPRRWHVLDNGPQMAARGEAVIGTVLCVHGNPTWAYLWRRVLAQAAPGWRVVAVDHLGMGYSDRLAQPRTLAQRVDDLGRLTSALDIRGPVVPLAHDWGGPIALGWTLQHTADIAGVVLTNTAVHQPEGQPKPRAITATRSRPLLDLLTMRTPAFVAAATALSRPALPKDVRGAFASPYGTAGRRTSVRDFVADVPFETDHPSHATLAGIAEGVADLLVPALLVWGTNDPVFSARYLEDLQSRLRHADVQVYPRASHLVLEDHPEGVQVIWSWILNRFGATTATHDDQCSESPAEPAASHTPAPGVPLRVRAADPDTLAIVELGASGVRITRGALAERVDEVARALYARGVQPGQRVAVLIPPGIDLNTVVYAVWRLGAVVVVADAGLGLARLGAALRSTTPDHVIGIRAALLLARATRVPGARISADASSVRELITHGRTHPPVPVDAAGGSDAEQAREAAILFTSGATGPPKGVVYTRAQLSAQVTMVRDAFDLNDGEGFVAAFAPFALYGPPLGLPCAVPDMDVTAPHTLSAAALADAVASVKATTVFASPAALRNVVATAADLSAAQRAALGLPRLVMSAGAPVPASLLRQVQALMPAACTQTPYGMTEVLPVATIDPTTLGEDEDGHVPQGTGEADGSDGPPEGGATRGGVCVGAPLAGVDVRIAPLGDDTLSDHPWVLGEIVVRAPHVKLRYHRAWAAQHASERPAGWHRTGDVGHLDSQGRLWVQGRRVHVLHTSNGPLAPYPIEHRIAAVPDVADVAVVGVGPAGTAQCVAVVVPTSRVRGHDSPLADSALAAAVRDVADVPIAAVLIKDWLPVDIRHASKVDRTGLAGWASQVLHGRSPQSPLRRARAIAGRPGSAQPSTRSR